MTTFVLVSAPWGNPISDHLLYLNSFSLSQFQTLHIFLHPKSFLTIKRGMRSAFAITMPELTSWAILSYEAALLQTYEHMLSNSHFHARTWYFVFHSVSQSRIKQTSCKCFHINNGHDFVKLLGTSITMYWNYYVKCFTEILN